MLLLCLGVWLHVGVLSVSVLCCICLPNDLPVESPASQSSKADEGLSRNRTVIFRGVLRCTQVRATAVYESYVDGKSGPQFAATCGNVSKSSDIW